MVTNLLQSPHPVFPATAIADLSAVGAAVNALEYQMQAIEDRLREEVKAIPKAKKLIEKSLHQQRILEHMLAHFPSSLKESTSNLSLNDSCSMQEMSKDQNFSLCTKGEESVVQRKEKNISSAPRWYVIAEELESLSSYMRGRLTLEKVNAAVNEISAYADHNSQLISGPKKKLSEELWERVLELRDISMSEPVKGKHFILDSDLKGPSLKLDNTGKAILTILRHLGRVQESRIKHHRVFTLSRPQ